MGYNEKSEQDNILSLQREARQAYLKARSLKKSRDKTQEVVKKSVDRARHAKKLMQKAEDKRDKELAHNKEKIKAINARLDRAEKMFSKANAKVEDDTAAAAEAPAKNEGGSERDDMRDSDERSEELGDARNRDEYEPRRSRRANPERRSGVSDLSDRAPEDDLPHRRYRSRRY